MDEARIPGLVRRATFGLARRNENKGKSVTRPSKTVIAIYNASALRESGDVLDAAPCEIVYYACFAAIGGPESERSAAW